LLTDGVTLVVSPLISLMHDQIEHMLAAGVIARTINAREARAVEDVSEPSRSTLQQTHAGSRRHRRSSMCVLCAISLAARDVLVQHCASTWGHDFRPDYRELSMLKRRFANTPILAFTGVR
jgi:superfamily II DNA helicase RecQ